MQETSLMNGVSRPHAPGVTVSDHVSTSYHDPGSPLWKTPFLTSGSEITSEECGWSPVMWYIILCGFSHSLLILHAILTYQPVVNPSSNWGSICTVLMADAVVTGKVSCHNLIVRLHSLPRFVETISQGYCKAMQQPLACEDGVTLPFRSH